MADWYVSSASYASVVAWAATHAYTVGNLIKPTAPTFINSGVWRCTTAGTSAGTEPTWTGTPASNNGTVTDGGVTWTNVSGQSTYGWSAAAGTLYTLIGGSASGTGRTAPGDRVFISSDHSENNSSGSALNPYTENHGTSAYGLVQHISVNRAGSVPPAPADITSGAVITWSSTATLFGLDCHTNAFWQGITFVMAASAGNINLAVSGSKSHYFKNCTFQITGTAITTRISSTQAVKVIWDNCTVQFGNASQAISFGNSDFQWWNTPSAIQGATLPTILFTITAAVFNVITCRGVDLSAVTGTLVSNTVTATFKVLFDSCKISASASRLNAATTSVAVNEVELVNCHDGTNVINERYTDAGNIVTDRSTYLSGGAQDDIGNYSIKLASGVRSDFASFALDSFWLDVENTVTGASKTATVEIISSGTLNNNDVRLLLEYMGTSGNPVASFGDSLATVLDAASALPSSSNTWNSPPSTPQKQLLQITFTPQRAGRVRGLVRLGKVSTTVWVNPQITVT